MSILKWLGGIIGWSRSGILGGIIGYLIGQFLDEKINPAPRIGGSGYIDDDDRYTGKGPLSDFLVSLLVLSSEVIKADGKLHPSEMSYVREFIQRNFGSSVVDDAMAALNKLNTRTYNYEAVASQIAQNMNYSSRMQLFHYLVDLANADGELSGSEKTVLENIGFNLDLLSSDVASIIAMFYHDSASAYAVLEITPDATDEEVKKAYRRMAAKHHPDKVATLGPEVRKAATEKFQQVQVAYEMIKKERGMH